MITAGVRCSNTDYTYAVLGGSKDSPDLVKTDIVVFPKGYSRPELLKWLYQEFLTLAERHEVGNWAIKGSEPIAAKGNAYASRVEAESMVVLAAAERGAADVPRKVKATIAKDLGLKGRAKSLKDDLDYSLIDGLFDQPDKIFDAIVVAWSSLD